ncbi:MAG: hypothetical protein GX465_15220 [Acidobacteria bacterium]|jgi:hypothetical protein|nr:hypothetical protein [Acidobacteriota bacterium]
MVLVDIDEYVLDLLYMRMEALGDDSVNDVIMRDTLKYALGMPEFGERIELSDRARDLLTREAFNGNYL